MELLKRVNGVSSTHTTDQADKLKQDPLTDAQEIMKDYEDVFQGIGCFRRKHHIKIDPTVQPVVNPPRKIPFAMKDKVKKELD